MSDDLHCISNDQIVVKDGFSDALIFLGSEHGVVIHLTERTERVHRLLLAMCVNDVFMECLLIRKRALTRITLDCHNGQSAVRQWRMRLGFARRGLRRVNPRDVK